MTTRSSNLHGSAPDNARTALLLVDVINDLEFPGGAKLLTNAKSMARSLRRLKARASEAGVPTIYVNDNFGKWTSDFRFLVSHCVEDNVRGRAVVELLVPEISDYFVLKPKHSAFFSTTLDILLKHIGVSQLIIGGLTTDICVLFTANDAYMRDYELIIPSDCVASANRQQHLEALKFMKRVLGANTGRSTNLDFIDLTRSQR